MNPNEIKDLRTALEWLESCGEAPIAITSPIQARYQLAAQYAVQGGGVPVKPPTKLGLPMLFERVMPQDKPVLVGLFGSRNRCALLVGTSQDQLSRRILQAVDNPILPILRKNPPCQEVIEQQKVDLAALPIPTLTPKDAGAYITMGLCLAKDPETGEQNVSVHRLCVQGQDKLTIWMVAGRHLESFYLKAQKMGQNLPISIHIGIDPAIYLASCCPSYLAPFGCNELAIAGGLRGSPVELSPCITLPISCISQAEYVLEGEILGETMAENPSSKGALPEFLGYDGEAHPALPIVKIRAITHRFHPLFQTVIGPGYEQSNLVAFGLEAAVLRFLHSNFSDRFVQAYCSSAGGGALLLFLQFAKTSQRDDELVRQGALRVLEAFRLIKTIVLVDEDVDVFNEEDVWWAMTTRFQADRDLIVIPKTLGFALDPSQNPTYSPTIERPGMTSKVIFDCTVPFSLKGRFQRSHFQYKDLCHIL
ncbi:MAG: UbiD family decarboxylase [Xenococcaceae cyanobacterium MO_167.B27]|nr:UbiD family decarboxylase [Xenococcaceae cyanobacterium MO_167.B27]